jgi:hypothetical protein
MPKNQPLQPDDFPLAIKDKTIVTQDGEEVATTPSPEQAGDMADRLNEDAERRHEENWSA